MIDLDELPDPDSVRECAEYRCEHHAEIDALRSWLARSDRTINQHIRKYGEIKTPHGRMAPVFEYWDYDEKVIDEFPMLGKFQVQFEIGDKESVMRSVDMLAEEFTNRVNNIKIEPIVDKKMVKLYIEEGIDTEVVKRLKELRIPKTRVQVVDVKDAA